MFNFLVHCVQMIGVFAVTTVSNPDPKEQTNMLISMLGLFREGIANFVYSNNTFVSPWMQFRNLFSRPPFRCYAVEAVQDLTYAITNLKERSDIKCHHKLYNFLLELRDVLISDLDVCSLACNLPSLMMSRQVHGPKHVHQHSLLLKGLAGARNNGEIYHDMNWFL